MAFINYKIMRALTFLVAAIIPFLMAFFLLFLEFPIIGIFIFGIIIALIIGVAGFIATGSNPWIKAIQGDALLVIEVTAKGVGKFYNATVNNSPFGGIEINVQLPSGDETRVYDRDVTSRIQGIFKLIMRPFNKKKEDSAELEKKIAFLMPKEDYDKAAWHYDYLTILFYNSETGMFLTKPIMSEQEKQMQAEYLSLNEWKELKSLNVTMRNFTRQTFDLIGQKFGGIFGSPWVKLVIVVVIALAAMILLIQFFPQIQAAIMPAAKSAAQSTGQVVTPLPSSTPPVGK